MLLLLVDNFDSFTFNLVQAFQSLGARVEVVRNIVTLNVCRSLNPDRLVIGPGPGSPDDSGVSMEAIEHFKNKIPILGVCLGHQCIAQIFGGSVIRSPLGPMHGKTSPIMHTNQGIFKGLATPFTATRYHSLIVEKSLPECLETTAMTPNGEIMGIMHRNYSIEGVQFHPESVLTIEGNKLLSNFLYQGSPP